MIAKDVLEKNGHEVVADASNGKDAIEKFQQTTPDLTIMDITMPEMNGLEALKKILEIDKKAKIIMCSALSQQKLIEEAIVEGAKDYIVKPFKPERLISAIEKALES